MVYLFINGNVKDFDMWHKVFIKFKPRLKEMGVTVTSIYREIDNHQSLTVVHEFLLKEDAIKYVNNAEMKEVRKQAGVLATPKIWYTEMLSSERW
ncbi:hypothetical protein ACCI51_04615 [Microbulbifer echini]|uniref:DUF1330 domain-containing protein n=1 Tax=Microbulbifer echini TaxID=1529067 RepID=A0ABV4NKC4_9GAMM